MDLDRTVTEIAPALLAFAAGMSGDPHLGEEAAQDALTALVVHWRREGPPDSPRAFAYAVARRALRRALWRRRLLGPLDASATRRHADPDPDPEESARWRDELARAADGLCSLGRHEREALLLVAAGDLSTHDAARVLGISRSSFKMRVHRARKHLAAYLEKNDGIGHGARAGGSTAGAG